MANFAWVIFQLVSMSPTIRGYRNNHKSSLSISLLLLSSSQIFTEVTEPFSSLNSIFCLLDTIALVLSAWRTFASSLMNVFSFVFAVFAFSNRSMFLPRSMFTYNLIELHLIPKMLVGQNNNADQLSSQFVTSV